MVCMSLAIWYVTELTLVVAREFHYLIARGKEL